MKKKYLKNIKKMILMRVLLFPFILLMLLGGSIVYYFTFHASQQVEQELARIATDHQKLIDCFLNEKTSTLKFILFSNNYENMCRPLFLNDLFTKLQAESKAIVDLGVFDNQGKHVAYAGPYDLAGKKYSTAKWFKAVKEKGVYISDEFLGFRNIPHFIIAVRRDNGDQTWYLRATIDTYYFNDLVESIRIRKTGEAYIVNKKGVFQTRRRSGGKLMEIDPDFQNYQLNSKKVTAFTAGGKFNNSHLYAAIPMKQTNWYMIVRQAATDAYAPLIFTALVAIFIILGGGTVVVVAAFIMTSNMASKLQLADVEKREMKTQLIIAGKLAEVGEMSTGVAHEINNPLQVMRSEITMIQDVTSDFEAMMPKDASQSLDLLKDSTDQIKIQIQRCSKITQGLLNFARKTETVREKIKIQELIPEIVNMVDQKARVENIRIVQKIDPDIPETVSDSNQLQQVFLNLLNNAVYALKGNKSGQIRIEVIQENSEIVISIADNGCGFTPENMEKAFIPFFTTKPVGQGTGLGLSTVYGIIKGLDGDINLTSELNIGSVFTIRLPLIQGSTVDDFSGL
ncbi:MAG: ATP-binding protein [Thermodesulfobacteriota bacterium]|nr:ATP-binding protein [Thermodesulfobacteriota bacterium]